MAEQAKFGEFCWNELATSNIQAAKDFYGEVFGWEFVDHKMGDGTTYTLVKLNDKEIAGMWVIPKEKEIPPHWMAYILVENLEKSLEKASANGATIVKPASKAGDFGYFAIIKDPTNAYVALWQSLQGKK